MIKQRLVQCLPNIVRARIEESTIVQKIAHNTGWLFIDRALRMGVGFIVSVWITRYLGPEQFGVLSYTVAFSSLFTAIANLGLYGVVVREIVRQPEFSDEILGTAFTLKCIGGLFAFSLSLAGIILLRPIESRIQLLVGIIALGLIFQSLDVFDFWFQSQLQSKKIVIVSIPGFLLATITKILLVSLKAPLIAFAWVAVFEVLVGGLCSLIAYQLATKRMGKLKTSLRWAKSLIKDSWPLMFAGMMIMVYNRIDQVIIGQMLDNRSVGLYAVAVKIAEFWYVFPTLLLNSILPTLVEAKKSGESFYYKRIQKVCDLLAIISYAFIIPMLLFSQKIVSLLYGDAYVEAGGVLSVYVLSGVFVFLGHIREYWVAIENITKFSMYSTALGAIVNILLNCLLIPLYGIMGAAIATLVALIMGSYLINSFGKKTRNIFVSQTKSLLLISFFSRMRRI